MDASGESRAPGYADRVTAAVAAGALLPFTVVEVLDEAGGRHAAWAAAVLGCYVLLHLLVVVRRRLPRTAIAAASALMLVLAALSVPGMPGLAVLQASSLVYLVFVFAAAAGDDLVAGWAALGCGLAGAGIMTGLVIVSERPNDAAIVASPGAAFALAGSLAGGIGVAWALGRYRRETLRKRAAERVAVARAAELRIETELRAVADERRRIGRELHDVIAHSLAVMVAQAEATRVLVGRDDDRARVAVGHVVSTGRAAMRDMRGLLGALVEPGVRAGIRDEGGGGGESALREPSPGLDGIAELVERAQSPGRAVELVVTGTAREVPPGLALTAYRVVQEALTNVLRHASPPTTTRVGLEWGRDLVVTVDDDGQPIGLPIRTGASDAGAGGSAAARAASGRGIPGMRERVAQLGGSLDAGPRPDGPGWRVVARLPLVAAPVRAEGEE
ncbi:sensor histidine kinase [Agromyces sp. NPDC055658]